MRGGVCATQGMKVVLKVGQSKSSDVLISPIPTPVWAPSHAVSHASRAGAHPLPSPAISHHLSPVRPICQGATRDAEPLPTISHVVHLYSAKPAAHFFASLRTLGLV